MNVSPSANDSELFNALRGGDPRALDALFRRHYADLCRTAVRFVNDPASAEDIVQELFVHLWAKRSRLSPVDQSVAGYLRRSVRNRSLNYLRDRKRIPVDDGEPPETRTSDDVLPGAALEEAERSQRIARAIDRLPERCRLVFVMSKVEEMSHGEIAHGLGISVKTVENQMTRAYKYLRQWLAIVNLLIIMGNA